MLSATSSISDGDASTARFSADIAAELATIPRLFQPPHAMKTGDPCDERLPWIRKLHDLDEARAHSAPGHRLDALRAAGRSLGDALRSGGDRILGVKTLNNATLPYPTRFAFNGAVPLPWPMVIMIHRTLLMRVKTDDGIKHVLFNPTDAARAASAPFFLKLREKITSVAPFAERFLTRDFASLGDQLNAIGVSTSDIDVIAYDHFHTQDLRDVLGANGTPARFPNALLLAPRREWTDWDGLHPMQKAWFIEDGKKGIPDDKVVLTDNDLIIGNSALLVQTPGHTSGNQTLFVLADGGIFGCCENGTSADSWTPHHSTIPGIRRYANYYDVEVVLNANTPELGGEQYISMVLEKSIVDKVESAPDFVQMFPSSEVTATPLAPRISPTMVFKHRDSGCFR